MTHLDSIGLIQFGTVSGFTRTGLPKSFAVSYCGKPLNLTMDKEDDNTLSIGKVLLTQVGAELARVCRAPGVEDFVDYVKEQWKTHLLENENTEH